ncbi:CPBP family intramembrane glutamic endopeptidase [Streptomyces sp. NPDC048566]|uniref:CPBP family intramembrane glutamic endopeptidase n=1 Tax=Streptomyces sp. NPDC048566 TaxID=3365569 RepID=UPI0037186537
MVVLLYLGIIQGLGALLKVDTSGADSQFPTTEGLVRNTLIPVAVSVVFVAAVVTWLGWWKEVLHYRVPVQRWVRWVPILMLIGAVINIDFPNLTQQSASLTGCLVLLVMLVGVGEELMFRGIGVQVFKRAGLSEAKIALWTSVVFGLAHLSNALDEGARAILQALIVSTSGYFLYLCLRVAGTILLPMLVHACWDFGLLSSQIGSDPAFYAGSSAVILVQVALIIVLLIRRRHIEPAPSAPLPQPSHRY